MPVTLIQDHIAPGRQNRPSTNPKSSRYRIIIPPKYITIHNAWSPWDARGLNNYQKGDSAAARPASWHLSVSNNLVVQGVPFGETAWHAGDYVNIANPGIGNTQSIGIEICDFYNSKTKRNNQELYLLAEAYSVVVVAYLIKNVTSLLPFPECVVPHAKWRAASGCPSRILGRKNGWEHYIDAIDEMLQAAPPNPGMAELIRAMPVKYLGKDTNILAYLGKYPDGRVRTFAEIGPTVSLSNLKAEGKGTYVNIAKR